MKSFLRVLSVFALLLSLSSICQAQQSVTAKFRNDTDSPAKVCWVNGDQWVTYAVLQPGECHEQPTYTGHFWSISNGKKALGHAVTRDGQEFCLCNGNQQPAPQPYRGGYQDDRNTPPADNSPGTGNLNQKVLDFAKSSVGRRLGNGQCTELAVYALRAAGANPGRNYVWGTRLNSVRQVQPGDIVQFQNVRFQYPDGSSTWSTGPHTAIVVSVSGNNVQILEQNVSGSPVQYGQFNERYKSGGTVTYYRPQGGQGGQFAGDQGPQFDQGGQSRFSRWKDRIFSFTK